jgi:hypothetical protein
LLYFTWTFCFHFAAIYCLVVVILSNSKQYNRCRTLFAFAWFSLSWLDICMSIVVFFFFDKQHSCGLKLGNMLCHPNFYLNHVMWRVILKCERHLLIFLVSTQFADLFINS